MLTMSLTELSKSVKCIGLLSPICIGPIISASVFSPWSSLYAPLALLRFGNTSVFTSLPLRRENGNLASRSSLLRAKFICVTSGLNEKTDGQDHLWEIQKQAKHTHHRKDVETRKHRGKGRIVAPRFFYHYLFRLYPCRFR